EEQRTCQTRWGCKRSEDGRESPRSRGGDALRNQVAISLLGAALRDWPPLSCTSDTAGPHAPYQRGTTCADGDQREPLRLSGGLERGRYRRLDSLQGGGSEDAHQGQHRVLYALQHEVAVEDPDNIKSPRSEDEVP